jgi:transposase InsO family protein
MATKQAEDPDIGPVYLAKSDGIKPPPGEQQTESPATRHYFMLWDSLYLNKGVLVKKFTKQNGVNTFTQLLLPRVERKAVLSQMHNSVLSGHLGTKRTKEKTLRHYYWYAMKEDINTYVAKCDICAADKMLKKPGRAPMGHLFSGAPWDVLAMDFIGPFPVTPRGNKYILVLTDHFTKYTEVMAVPNQTAEECATRVMNDFVSRWGAPLTIHSDQGAAFESRLFKELCEALEVKKTRTSPRNPKGNGQSERYNRTLLKMVRAYLTGEQQDWDLNLGCLAGAYRCTPNESTKLSPNLLALGREIRLPSDLVYTLATSDPADVPEYLDHVEELKERMLRAHDIARKYLKTSAKRSKNIYDSKTLLFRYKQGDLVWCLHESRKVGVNPKLERRFEGPYLVKEARSDLSIVVQLDESGTLKLLHHDKLKPYRGDKVPKWVDRVKRKWAKHANKSSD